ncbi:MAG TPA: hypothetical protein VFV87_00780, partial [Pirellulaceae bacterium]|nr:hypothetical protein [Pirellulaceae bacterium]
MTLQSLLGEQPVSRFIAEHYQRLPYSLAGGADSLRELGTWESLTAILGQPAADLLVCRRNERYDGPAPRTADDAR